MADLGIIAAVLFAYGLLSRRLERWAISAPMIFVAAGVLLGPDVLDATDLELTNETALTLAEVALVIVLFADAARIDLGVLRGNSNLPARLLGLGMPLTIGLGIAAGAALLGGIDFWEAAIIAAVLAPTDAALGQAVVSSDLVPRRIRQALNVESGLNDGLATPFVFLFLALAVSESELSASGWPAFAGEQIGYGIGVGLLIGIVGGALIDRAVRAESITATFQQLAVLGLAIAAWALAGEIDGNGFIAAFVAGLAAGRITKVCGEQILNFSEDEGQLFSLTVFFIFGLSAIDFLGAASWEVVLYALLSLTLLRMLPVLVATVGTGLRASSRAFLGWFGPRGLASIILALIVVEEEPDLPGLDVVLAAMTVTVLVSVFAHGISARPLVRVYARHIGEMPERSAEMEEVPELPTRGGLNEPM